MPEPSGALAAISHNRSLPVSRIRAAVPTDQVWFVALVSLAVLARLYNFGHPPDDAHEWRQTQTLMYAASYAHGAGLLTPNSNWNGVPAHAGVLEFPIYSILVYWMSALMDLVTAGRVVSFLCGVGALVLFDRLCVALGHPRRRTATLLFAFAPITVFYAHALQPEALLLLLVIAAAYFAVRSSEGWGWVVAACASLSVAATIKPTALLVLAPPLIYLAWQRHEWLRLGTVLVGAAFVVVAWAVFVHAVLLVADPLWYQVNSDPAWSFGPLSIRYSAEFYVILLSRLLIILLPLLAVVLVVVAARRRVGHPFWWWWLAGSVAAILIFANLNEIHFYYQLPMVPALAALAAYAGPAFPKGALGRLGLSAVLLAAAVLGSAGIYREQPVYFEAGQALASASRASPTKPVVVMSSVGGNFNWPTVLYYAGRDGWNVPFGSDAARISSLPGPTPCWMVIVLDVRSAPDALPSGWQEMGRTRSYVLGQNRACQ
jgi:hypothetical protein